MATTISRTLASRTSLTHIRPSTVTVRLRDARPNTKMYVFFDNTLVNEFCQPIDASNVVGLLNADIITDTNGECSFVFNITANRWTSGSKEMVVSDVSDPTLLLIPGNVYGSARATYNTQGTLEIYNNTRTIETVIENYVTEFFQAPPPMRGDPLAQSFFTHGVTGGCFVTSVELYFQSKDSVIPVRVELRRMENGFPTEFSDWNKDAYATLNPVDVLTSNDASVATKFTFNAPVYLEEDKDYCFVVMANSNNYNLWTSHMSERSIETGRVIFSQPYVGSLFKSQNNYTWTPEQFEDLKFTLNKAQFNTAVSSDLTFIATSPSHTVSGRMFTTTDGSSTILYKSSVQHGLNVGSKFKLDVDVDGTYNGIPGTSIQGEWNVSRVIDEFSVEFIVGATATKTGKIESSGIIRNIYVEDGGINYTTATTITVSAPTVGTTAIAAPVVINGKISRVEISNKGSGYENNPTILISGAGTGASLLCSVEPNFVVTTNKKVNQISPQVKARVFQDTDIVTTLNTTSESYGVGPVADMRFDSILVLDQTALVASRSNEAALMNNSNSFEMNVVLTSSNPNVSPAIDTRSGTHLMAYTNAINAQSTTESIESTNASSGLVNVVLTSGGSGYSGTPVVEVIVAENETSTDYVLPTLTTTVSSGVVSGINIVTSGSGLTKPPLIRIASPMAGTGATAYGELALLNSELNTRGSAASRYITKPIRLKTVSGSIKLFCLAYSSPETDIDWYIRSSLSSDITKHTDNQWVRLKCDVPRDRSRSRSEYYEYEFYIDGLEPFDVYDLKMVPSSTSQSKIPYVKKYRSITIA